jgi:serine/threonine-protein kinase HipA
MRQGLVYYNKELAGLITETDDGDYVFQYDVNYVKNFPWDFITFTMPVRDEPYTDKRLFSVFDGLIPEGWLLDVATKTWKINPNDRMGLLLACCQETIGAVSVIPENKDEEK